MNKFFVVMTMLTLMVSYQNCANNLAFDAQPQLVEKVGSNDNSGGALVVPDESNTYDGVIEEIADSMPGRPAPQSPGAGNPNYPVGDDDDGSDYAAAKASHVCILEGPGNSIRLGYIGEQLSNDTSTINDICMSERACQQIVSKAFIVKGAERRGYCGEQGERKDIVRWSDQQVDEAIKAEILKRMTAEK